MKNFSAVLAAAAGAALISLSASSFANEESPYPMSVNETGPVLAQQASDRAAEGVAGRPGLGIESKVADASGVYEVQTPSRGGPIDD
jgi:uncharacterized low-complexity protein